MVSWSNLILDPTTTLKRVELGFRIRLDLIRNPDAGGMVGGRLIKWDFMSRKVKLNVKD